MIGPRIKPPGIIQVITELKRNKTRPEWLLKSFAIQSSFVRSQNNRTNLQRSLPTMSRAWIRWGLILPKSARTVSSGIFQVLQTSTIAPSIFSMAWAILVSCHLYRSVLSSGSGSENSFCSSSKALESATSNRSWNSLRSMSCRVLTIAPVLVTIRSISAFKVSLILGIEISWIAAPDGRLKALRLWYSATSLYMRSGAKKSVYEPYRKTSVRLVRCVKLWYTATSFWTSKLVLTILYDRWLSCRLD